MFHATPQHCTKIVCAVALCIPLSYDRWHLLASLRNAHKLFHCLISWLSVRWIDGPQVEVCMGNAELKKKKKKRPVGTLLKKYSLVRLHAIFGPTSLVTLSAGLASSLDRELPTFLDAFSSSHSSSLSHVGTCATLPFSH